MTPQVLIFNKNKGFLPGIEKSTEDSKAYGVLRIFQIDESSSKKVNGVVIYKPKSLIKLSPCAKWYFRNTGSIDSTIEALQWLKENMINYALVKKEEDNETSTVDGPPSGLLSSDPQDSREIISGNSDT